MITIVKIIKDEWNRAGNDTRLFWIIDITILTITAIIFILVCF